MKIKKIVFKCVSLIMLFSVNLNAAAPMMSDFDGGGDGVPESLAVKVTSRIVWQSDQVSKNFGEVPDGGKIQVPVLVVSDGHSVMSVELTPPFPGSESPFWGKPVAYFGPETTVVVTKRTRGGEVSVKETGQKLNGPKYFEFHKNILETMCVLAVVNPDLLLTIMHDNRDVVPFQWQDGGIVDVDGIKYHITTSPEGGSLEITYKSGAGKLFEVTRDGDRYLVHLTQFGSGRSKTFERQLELEVLDVELDLNLPSGFGHAIFKDYRTGDLLEYASCNYIPQIEDAIVSAFSPDKMVDFGCEALVSSAEWNPFGFDIKPLLMDVE
jgi:hypothetical protein